MVTLQSRTTEECELIIQRYMKAGYNFVGMLSTNAHNFDDGYWDLYFKKTCIKGSFGEVFSADQVHDVASVVHLDEH